MDLQKEWEVARDVLAKADDRIQDARKLGFGFITTLLTADTFILHKVDANVSPSFGVVLSVTVVTVLLIIAVRLIERQQEILQNVIAGRAVVIERLCGAELTDVVSTRFVRDRWSWYGVVLHVLFISAVFVIAVSARWVWPSGWILAAICGTSVVVLLSLSIPKVEQRHATDWSLERIACKQTDKIRILVTNVSSRSLNWQKDDLVFGVIANDEKVAEKVVAPAAFELEKGKSRLFEWSPSSNNLRPGLYGIRPTNGGCSPTQLDEGQPQSSDLWPRCLVRRISVT